MSMIHSHNVEGVLHLALNRTSAANSLNAALYEALHLALVQAVSNDAVKSIILTGEGQKAFCAGADLKEFAELTRAQAELQHLDLLERCFDDVLSCSKPIVACVQAAAVGAGLMLAALCDEIVMADHTWVSLPEVLFDMPTPLGAAAIGHRVERHTLHRLVQLGERITATQCLSAGLATALAPSAQLSSVALARAQALGAIPAHAYAVNKVWLNQDLRAQLRLASQLARSTIHAV